MQTLSELESKISEKTGEIYLVTNTVNDKKYVGQCVSYLTNGNKHGYKGRWLSHLSTCRRKYKYVSLLYNAMRLHGPEKFKSTLIDVVDLSLLNDTETAYIKQYDTYGPNGYNLTPGGSADYSLFEKRKVRATSLMNRSLSEEQKQKMRLSATGKTMSTEARKKIGDAKKGINNPSFGKNLPSEEKAKKIALINSMQLPPNIYLTTNSNGTDGYIVRYVVNGKRKRKIYCNSRISLDKRLSQAIEFQKSLNIPNESASP